MSQNKEENTTQSTSAQQPQAKTAPSAVQTSVPDINAQDVFSSEVMINSTEEELFVGDLSFLKDLTSKSVSESVRTTSKANSVARSIFVVFIANIFLMLVLVGVVSFQSNKEASFRVFEPSSSKKVQLPEEATKDVLASQPAPKPTQSNPVAESGSGGLAEAMEGAVWSQKDQDILKRGVSLKTADELFSAGRYVEACYVYDQISKNWVSAGTNGEFMRDFLKLRMAICMHRAGQPGAGEECFTQALQSRAAYVRGMAFYYLARIHFQNQKYLEARQNAYQAIALYRAFEEMLPINLEADLYFLVADSLTREVVGFCNLENELPGRDWSDSLMDIWPTEPDALLLEEALFRTAQRLAEGAVGPRLTVDANRPVGSQWSLICLQSPLEETLWKVVSEANLKAVWEDNSQSLKDHPVSVYMTYVPQQYIAETICGSKGLIWQFDGQSVSILNPSVYTDFETHRSRLIQETISVWQRFLLRYRDDKRIANVHYALGRMYSFAGQSAAALGEFKLLQGRFSQNTLAPYAYLEASKIKVDMKDYEGAGNDLNEMLLAYPDCPVIDQATLYLARTAFESGQTERAKQLYQKSYQMNLSNSGQCESIMGLGYCAYAQKDWNGVQTWLSKALELMDDKNDSRTGTVCFMLGRAYIELTQYANAAGVLRNALNSKLSEKEYMQTILELVDAECRQQNFLEAMNILDQVPQGRFGQEESCNLLIAKTRILRDIGVVESAISLLRKKIEFVADSRLRARLTLELAECYIRTKEYPLARRELNNVLADMPDSYHARRASLILAQIIEKLGQPSRAEEFCLVVLNDPQVEENIRNEAFNTLGRIYAGQKYYEKAALAFAGILPQGAGMP